MKSSKAGLEMSAFCQWQGDTLVLNILGRPRANKTKIGKGDRQTAGSACRRESGARQGHGASGDFSGGEFQVAESAITVCSGCTTSTSSCASRAPQRLPAVIAKQLAPLRPGE